LWVPSYQCALLAKVVPPVGLHVRSDGRLSDSVPKRNNYI